MNRIITQVQNLHEQKITFKIKSIIKITLTLKNEFIKTPFKD